MFRSSPPGPSMIRCPLAVCQQTARGWSRPWACRASPRARCRGSAKIEPFSSIGPRTMARDGKVKAFLDRPIEGDWPYLWIDATYLKVRRGGRIVSVAVIVEVGVNTDGRREVLGMDIGTSEAELIWTEFLHKLTRRGLRGVKLVTSDAHEGIKAAVSKVLSATWQRCRVHFMRNVLAHAGKSRRVRQCLSDHWRSIGSPSRPSSPPPSPRTPPRPPAPNDGPWPTRSDQGCRSWRQSWIEPMERQWSERHWRGPNPMYWPT